jgi:pimeloyl-ACP methyl ester carboxylesterase
MPPERRVIAHAGSGHIEASVSGEGPPVVLLHGIPGSSASWAAVARRLAAEHTVVVPDLLGFGGSARPRALSALHARGQAAAVAALLDHLALERVAIVGHDFGGPVALALTERDSRRVSHLGLLATNAFPDTPIPFPLALVTAPVIGGVAARALFSRPSLRMMLRQGTRTAETRVDARTAVGDRSQAAAIRTIFAGSLRKLGELYAPAEAQLRTTSVPTLVGWGSRDPFFTVAQGERTAQAAGANLVVYEGAGHFLPEERPTAVADDIAALLRLPIRV